MTTAESQRIAQERLADIARRQVELAGRVTSIQRRLAQALDEASERMLGQPATADGTLLKWAKTDLAATVGQWAGDIIAVGASNGSYFSQLAPSAKNYLAIQAQAVPLLLNRFGLGAGGELQPGGFFAGFMGDTNLATQVKQLAWKSKAAGVGLQQFKKDINALVDGTPDRAGLVQRHFNTFAYDTYQQADAQTQDFYAVKLGLPAALYLGGEIAGTREFCSERQGNVYTREEIAGWIELQFNGKTPDYNPFTDRGGYNCRHHLHYITARMAASRRTDLTVGPDGKLYKDGAPQPVVVAPARQTAPDAQPEPEAQVAEPEAAPAVDPRVAQPQPSIGHAEAELERLGIAKRVEYGKTPLAVANDLNATLGRLAATYDVPAVQTLEIHAAGKNGLSARSMAHYDPNDNRAFRFNQKFILKPDFSDTRLTFAAEAKTGLANIEKAKAENPDWFTGAGAGKARNRAILSAAKERLNYSRFTVDNAGYAYNGTATHEYGHAIQDAVSGLPGRRGYTPRRRTNPALVTAEQATALHLELEAAYKAALKSGDIYKLSEYAATSAPEFFAEAFTMLEFEPQGVPAAIKDFLTKYLSHAKR